MPPRRPQAPIKLRLYIAGNAPNSVTAASNAKAICDEHFAGHYTLEIVDMLTHPRRALDDGVIVTPTLLKLLPLPLQHVIGNLSDTERVLMILAGK